MQFTWSPFKADSNIKKHGVSFDEALTAFADIYARRLYDGEHSTTDEERWILLGLSHSLRLLVVVHVECKVGVIRIVSARKATKTEVRTYQELKA